MTLVGLDTERGHSRNLSQRHAERLGNRSGPEMQASVEPLRNSGKASSTCWGRGLGGARMLREVTQELSSSSAACFGPDCNKLSRGPRVSSAVRRPG